MAPAAQMIPRFAKLIGLLVVAGLLSACQPRRQIVTATASLPPPQIGLTRAPLDTATLPPVDTETPAPLLTPTDYPSGTAALARAKYGPLLIERISIPRIAVLAPVTPVGWSPEINLDEVTWDSPAAQVGWAVSSDLPGSKGGNVILFGHNNIDSSVFMRLAELQPGDEIILNTGEYEWHYQVSQVNIYPVSSKIEDSRVYLEYFKSSRVPRLTLVSCWPPVSNTHRVFVVAFPVKS
jgi:LPXTG-site transpeptidase (sortase) family protein